MDKEFDKVTAKRNLWIFVVGVLVISTLGGAIMASGYMIGALLMVLGPAGMASILRQFGGDGWKDAGLGLSWKASRRWFLFALLAYPLTQIVILVLGSLSGLLTIDVGAVRLVTIAAAGLAIQLPIRMIAAFGEEWGWRGYMEPRLEALGVPDIPRHLTVGIVWALWHFPLIFATPYTELALSVFLPLFILGALVASVVYGQMRKRSRTVWTSILMHGAANTVAFSIIGDGTNVIFHNKAVAYFGIESIAVIGIWTVIGLWLLSKRTPTI